MGTQPNMTLTPSRAVKRVREKRTQKRGTVIRVYPEGWLLTEMEDGSWGLFTPEEVELVE